VRALGPLRWPARPRPQAVVAVAAVEAAEVEEAAS
jgi:hypothetical protein